MTQYKYETLAPTDSGLTLLGRMNGLVPALLTQHKGVVRPSYVQPGMMWIDDSGAGWVVNLYDGASDIALFAIDPSGHVKSIPDYAPLKSPAFTENPTAPTQSAKNSSIRLSTTAFVQTEKGYQRGITTLAASTTLTSAHLGNLVVCNATGAITLTLPAAASYAQGIINLVNINTGLVTVSGSIIYDGATVTSLGVPPGSSISLVSNATSWVVTQQTLPTLTGAEWLAGVGTVDGPISPATLKDVIAANPPSALPTASGAAPSYSARAWANFNGSGTVAIRASGNVSSITDNGTGDYTVNFATAMPNANYAAVANAWTGVNAEPSALGAKATTSLTTSVRINAHTYGGLVSLYDAPYINVAIFG